MQHATIPKHYWDTEIAALAQSGPSWIWHGWLARGTTTLLTSQWKSGKTTLLAMLLGRRVAGGTLAGRDVSAGKTVVISEEPLSLWAERVGRYGFGGNVCLFPRPFVGVPTSPQWRSLLLEVLRLHQSHGIDLAVIDPLAPFLTCENNARSVLESLLPLTALNQVGMGVLLLHHPAKGERRIGEAARGSGALLGHVDISIEMRHPGGDPQTRRRRFLSLSRFTETPRQLLLELNADATDYLPVAAMTDTSFDGYVAALQMVLDDAPQKLTRADILAEWPADFDKPADTTLKLWLNRAVEAGTILREGTGHKGDPFRYWLPATEARWREKMFMYDHFEQQRRDLKLPFESLEDRKRIEGGDAPLDGGCPDGADGGDSGDGT